MVAEGRGVTFFSDATTHKLLNHLSLLLMQAILFNLRGSHTNVKVGSPFVGNQCFRGRMGDETV